MKQIRVHAVYYKDRKEWLLYYRDPVTKRRVFKSTGVKAKDAKSKSDVNDLASEWQKEVRESRSNISWEDFRRRYEDEVCSGLAAGTDRKVFSVFNSIENILSPTRLNQITPDAISRYQTRLREKGLRGKALSESTIASHLAHLKAALNWAVDMGLLGAAPKIRRPQRASQSKKMKGRPITREEFERMLAKVESVVIGKPPEDATDEQKAAWSQRNKPIVQAWTHYLEGLWWSGLRVGESLQLYWDRDHKLKPLLAGEDSCLVIPAELEKGNKDRIIPMAPEFVELLERTPPKERRGPVFRPVGKEGGRLGLDRVIHLISGIGRAAKVVVERGSDGKPKKYASAHDFRRAFGERWSKRIMPAELKELMRHESIETTLRFYVGENARQTAKNLWAAYRNNRPDDATPRQQNRQQRGAKNRTKNQP
jgi:integrase